MISAGVKDVKNNLSRLLARVKAGEVVVITDRGRPVARIVNRGMPYVRHYCPWLRGGLLRYQITAS